MARLKVFHATLGFFETVVAAPSKKAALQAWGAHQDLFATGAADRCRDGDAQAAALARPGVVLRRPVGSTGAFREEAGLDGILLPKPRSRARRAAGVAVKAAKPKPPPDRSKLDAAEKALFDLEARHERDRAALDDRRRALDAEAEALRADYSSDRARLRAKRDEAEAAYRKAGG